MLFFVNVDRPVKIGGTIPLANLGLFVQLTQCRAGQRVVPREDGISIVFDNVLNCIDIIIGDGKDSLDVIEVGTTQNVLVFVFGNAHFCLLWF